MRPRFRDAVEVMSDKITDKIEDCAACCCVDVGAIIDNSDTSTTLNAVCKTEDEAMAVLSQWTEHAENAASEPVTINHKLEQVELGYSMTAEIIFSCQAELLIFQLGQR